MDAHKANEATKKVINDTEVLRITEKIIEATKNGQFFVYINDIEISEYTKIEFIKRGYDVTNITLSTTTKISWNDL